MQTSLFQTWWTRVATFGVAAMASGSVAWWAMTLSNSAPWQASVSTTPTPLLDGAVLARAFGAGAAPAVNTAPVPPQLAMQLLGVVAGAGGKGHALLIVGDAPAKTYKVGSNLGEGLLLQSVGLRSAQVGPNMKGPASQILELPPLSRP